MLYLVPSLQHRDTSPSAFVCLPLVLEFRNLGNYKIKILQGQLLHWGYVRLVSMCQQGWMKNCEKKQESVNSRRRNDRDASTNTWRCHGTNTYLRGKKYFLPSAADKKLPGQSRIVRVWKRRQREGRGNLIIATQRHKEIRIKAFLHRTHRKSIRNNPKKLRTALEGNIHQFQSHQYNACCIMLLDSS